MSPIVRSRADYPTDAAQRDELAFQLWTGRRERRVVDAVRALGRTMRQAEDERATIALYRDWAPGELAEAWGR